MLFCMQLAALDLLKSSNPKGRFWIKIDATDIKRCIMESQRKVWNGDEDLGDGKLEALRDEYEERMADMHKLKSRNATEVKEVLPRVLVAFTDDVTFLDKGFHVVADHFEKKSRQANCPQETLKEANWEVVEYQILLQQSQELHQEFENLLTSLADMTQAAAIIPTIHNLATSSIVYLRSIFKKKRTAATHVLVLMLSDERRAKKPYALPVRYVPCRTLKDQFIRDLTKDLKQEMKQWDLHLSGEMMKLYETFFLWVKQHYTCTWRHRL